MEGGAGAETGAEGGAYRERAAQRAAKRAVVHELLLHKCWFALKGSSIFIRNA